MVQLLGTHPLYNLVYKPPRHYGMNKTLYLVLGFVSFTRATTSRQNNVLVRISQIVSLKREYMHTRIICNHTTEIGINPNHWWVLDTDYLSLSHRQFRTNGITFVMEWHPPSDIIRYNKQESFITRRFDQLRVVYSELRNDSSRAVFLFIYCGQNWWHVECTWQAF